MNNGSRDSPCSDWFIQVPLKELLALQNVSSELAQLREENSQLRRRLEGLHSTLYSTMEIVNELKKSISVRISA